MATIFENANPKYQAGSGTATYTPSGILTVSTTSVGTDANTNEKDLWTYSLPANTLNADGRAVRLNFTVTFANTATVKTVRVYFGATSILFNNSTSPQNAAGSGTYTFIRTGAAAQLALKQYVAAGTTLQAPATATPAADTTAAITIKVTGQNGTANANDIVFIAATVELL
jgi:hypothetical protein